MIFSTYCILRPSLLWYIHVSVVHSDILGTGSLFSLYSMQSQRVSWDLLIWQCLKRQPFTIRNGWTLQSLELLVVSLTLFWSGKAKEYFCDTKKKREEVINHHFFAENPFLNLSHLLPKSLVYVLIFLLIFFSRKARGEFWVLCQI